MKLFGDYLNGIDTVLSKQVTVTPNLIRENRNFSADLVKGNMSFANENLSLPENLNGPKVLFDYDKKFIENLFGKNQFTFDKITVGAHPDFSDIDEFNYLNHHCVSVFIDIKGSTRLIEKYSLLEVRLIKDSLLTLAIQITNQFGGHVHRLQGDGIFIQFVRRNQHENDSIINALNACSILTQFVKNDLASKMQEYGIRPLKIRIGIDFGEAKDVIWSYYGIPGCGELTTTSLHTDMAAKLQAKAYDNSILIGGNVKTKLDLKSDFYNYFENDESKERVYYISNQFTYPFFVFDWFEYLNSFPFMSKTPDGRSLEVKEKTFTIECYISDSNGTNKQRYFPNSTSIPKGKNISYYLKRNGVYYNPQTNFEKIEWHAYNSGKEAMDSGHSTHDFNKQNNNKTICETSAAYLGHHYVECKIIRDHSLTEKIRFPIFVQ